MSIEGMTMRQEIIFHLMLHMRKSVMSMLWISMIAEQIWLGMKDKNHSTISGEIISMILKN